MRAKFNMPQQKNTIIIAIDPGSVKCGVAALSSYPLKILEQLVVPSIDVNDTIERIVKSYPEIETVIIGDGTRSKDFINSIKNRFPQLKIQKVDEKSTTLAARERYCREVPAKGWRRLLPKGLRTPEKPIDDYVAVILAERWIKSLENN